MIANLFLPEKVGTYYLFSKRVVGIEIGKSFIQATKLRFSAHSIVVEKILQEKIKIDGDAESINNIVATLQSVLKQLAPYNELRVAFSASFATYKELKLPFASSEKIGLVLNYELEPLIPFPINSVVSDFIITRSVDQESSSELLVATVQKSSLEQFLQVFSLAGIAVDAVVIDMFALYALYQNFGLHTVYGGTVAVVDLGVNSTRIAHISAGQLKHIRTIPMGIVQVAKEAAARTSITAEEFIEYLVRFGIEKTTQEYPECHSLFDSFFRAIQLTLDSFTKMGVPSYKIGKIVLLGELITINHITDYCSTALGIACSFLDLQKMVQDGVLILKDRSTIPYGSFMSLAVALSSQFLPNFDLQKDEFKPPRVTLISKQLLCAAALSTLLLVGLVAYYMRQKSSVVLELQASTNEVIKALKKQFPKLEREKEPLDELVLLAQKEVDREREMWFAFSGSSQSRFLQYLLELTSKIDKKSLDFSIERLTISEGVMLVKAHVKNFEALKLLEHELRQSSLFEYVEPQNNPQFTMKIMLAPVVKEVQ